MRALTRKPYGTVYLELESRIDPLLIAPKFPYSVSFGWRTGAALGSARLMTKKTILEQLDALPTDIKRTLERYQFDRERFVELAAKIQSGSPEDNVVHGRVSPPEPEDVQVLPEAGSPEFSELEALGRRALEERRVALLVLAGGMATRMGGVVKALVEALPGRTFLDLRLSEIASIQRKFGQAPPLWLMTSHTTEEPIRKALGSRLGTDDLALFSQFLSLRLTPSGDVFLDEKGQPSEHAPGHGDVPDALKKSGLLPRFIERGGSVVMVTNLDNLGGTLEPAIIGWHVSRGRPVTSEVVDKVSDDRGGIPVRVDGTLCVLEEFRIPESFDPASVRVFNTNTFHVDAKALAELEMPWTYFRVKKKVDGAEVLQFERLINEITSHLPTGYLHVPRTGQNARFLPVKDPAELEARRPEIEAVAGPRGWLE